MASEVISHAIFASSHLTPPRTALSSTPPPTSAFHSAQHSASHSALRPTSRPALLSTSLPALPPSIPSCASPST